MRLRNMLKICLVFWKSDPRYAYKRYAYKKTCTQLGELFNVGLNAGGRFPIAGD